MATDEIIDIKPEQLELVKEILRKNLPGKQVWAYGSRVNGNTRQFSDLDLVVFDATALAVANAEDDFEESSLPYKVSIMLWEKLPPDFQENIKKKYVVLNF